MINSHQLAVQLNPLPCPRCGGGQYHVGGNTSGGRWLFKCPCGQTWTTGCTHNGGLGHRATCKITYPWATLNAACYQCQEAK